MKRTIYITILCCLAVFTATTFIACKKEKANLIAQTNPTNPGEEASPIETTRITNCHDEQNPLPSQIREKIVGDWLWLKLNCPMSTKTTNADKQVVVKFTDSGIFSVMENAVVESDGTWSLVQGPLGGWELKLSRQSSYLHGTVYICKDELLILDSYRDGCDHFFERR